MHYTKLLNTIGISFKIKTDVFYLLNKISINIECVIRLK